MRGWDGVMKRCGREYAATVMRTLAFMAVYLCSVGFYLPSTRPKVGGRPNRVGRPMNTRKSAGAKPPHSVCHNKAHQMIQTKKPLKQRVVDCLYSCTGDQS